MQWWEINRYINGLHRRYRTQWQNTRHLEWFLTQLMPRGKDAAPPPKAPEDLYNFGWEEDHKPAESISDEEYEEMQEIMRNTIVSW